MNTQEQETLFLKLKDELTKSYGDREEMVRINQLLDKKDFSTLFYDYDINGVRLCSECGNLMDEGFCIEDGYAYYCSKECLLKNESWDEYLKDYDNGDGNSYYTEWY